MNKISVLIRETAAGQSFLVEGRKWSLKGKRYAWFIEEDKSQVFWEKSFQTSRKGRKAEVLWNDATHLACCVSFLTGDGQWRVLFAAESCPGLSERLNPLNNSQSLASKILFYMAGTRFREISMPCPSHDYFSLKFCASKMSPAESQWKWENEAD